MRRVLCAEYDMAVGKERRRRVGVSGVVVLGQYGEASAGAYSARWSAVNCCALICQRCWACAPEYHHLEGKRLADVCVGEALCQGLVVQCLTWGQGEHWRCQGEGCSTASIDSADLDLGVDRCAG